MKAREETTRDSAFLMEQLELREELEASRDKPDPYAAIADLRTADINKRISSMVGQMAVQFETPLPSSWRQHGKFCVNAVFTKTSSGCRSRSKPSSTKPSRSRL